MRAYMRICNYDKLIQVAQKRKTLSRIIIKIVWANARGSADIIYHNVTHIATLWVKHEVSDVTK